MLRIILPATDDLEAVELNLEHSLVSLSKWESKHEKAFFGPQEKSEGELADYVNHMIVDAEPPEDFLNRLTMFETTRIRQYIDSKQSATWFREDQKARPSQEIITSELIYYWLINFQIPFQPTETWHLNRLLTLVKICGIKQTKPRPMNKKQQMEEYRRLNAERRAKLGTSG